MAVFITENNMVNFLKEIYELRIQQELADNALVAQKKYPSEPWTLDQLDEGELVSFVAGIPGVSRSHDG